MSTRCQIEIYDTWGGKTYKGALLYHHSDGYPDFMLDKLREFLNASYEFLKESGYGWWWDSERVAAVLILLSVEDYSLPLKPFSTKRPNEFVRDSAYRPNGGVPVFQPCVKKHGDIEYLYKVVLGKPGEFKISYKEV